MLKFAIKILGREFLKQRMKCEKYESQTHADNRTGIFKIAVRIRTEDLKNMISFQKSAVYVCTKVLYMYMYVQKI